MKNFPNKKENILIYLKHPNSSRVHAVELNNKYVIINVYFPVDPRSPNFDDFGLIKCLEDINWYFESFPNHIIIIAGDFNTDFSRNTRFVNIVRDFLMRNNLVTIWANFCVDFTFSSCQNRNGTNILSHSCIDHFILPQSEMQNISKGQVVIPWGLFS